jgi:hypothetical protein
VAAKLVSGLTASLLLGLAMLGGAPAAYADGGPAADGAKPQTASVPLLLRLSYWEVSDKGLAALAGKSRLDAGSIDGRRLQTATVMGVSGYELYIGLVRKTPIVYYDPRASQFQIQYVDAGLKLDAKAKAAAGGAFDLEIRPELSMVSGHRVYGTGEKAVSYPETQTFTSEISLSGVKLGQLIIVGEATGPSGTEHIRAMDPAPQGKHLIATIELEEP